MHVPFTRGGDPAEFTVNLDQVEFDSVNDAVVRTIAAYKGSEPTSLPPIADTVDPDALERLGESVLDEHQRGVEELTLRHSGVAVTICSTGEIRVQPADEGPEL